MPVLPTALKWVQPSSLGGGGAGAPGMLQGQRLQTPGQGRAPYSPSADHAVAERRCTASRAGPGVGRAVPEAGWGFVKWQAGLDCAGGGGRAEASQAGPGRAQGGTLWNWARVQHQAPGVKTPLRPKGRWWDGPSRSEGLGLGAGAGHMPCRGRRQWVWAPLLLYGHRRLEGVVRVAVETLASRPGPQREAAGRRQLQWTAPLRGLARPSSGDGPRPTRMAHVPPAATVTQ